MKRTIPLIITFLGGTVLLVAWFIPYTQGWAEDAAVWFDILAAIAFILGGGNLLKQNLMKISLRKPGWAYAAITLVAFIGTLLVGLLQIGVHPSEHYPDHPWSGVYNKDGAFWWCYEFIFKPTTATMFSMLAFYVASAAFRAFRAKNFEAILLLGTAFIILLGRTFAGVLMTQWMPESLSGLTIPGMSITIMSVFTAAGNRAIMIGIALGTVSTSLRVILGIDRSYLGKD